MRAIDAKKSTSSGDVVVVQIHLRMFAMLTMEQNEAGLADQRS